ncbi:HAD family hydrolase [Streptomyces gobiensis]|uniref:HAD family hydrolase n=1 Tax=Streptomyces gobiensis TaxID=2875706 RepID=UPI001E428375|nr:HAD-IA family hydrolase [Streptomyces gobiensis]UGY92283.1 HAD-IA family hydrolase [Streptomyces gobiensis]
MSSVPFAPWLREVRAVVLDTDGVIIDSARVHAAAWKEAFDPCLREQAELSGTPFRPFDAQEEYRRFVDGKSRLDGAADFLAARGLRLPPEAVQAVAARKEQAFTAALRRNEAEVWPGSVRLLRALGGAGVPCAAVSASRHARELLESTGVLELLRTVVDGRTAAELGLPGKPDPALFEEAARRLGTPASRTAVIEDALAGVEAGRRGGFSPVIGVDRTAGPDTAAELRAHGADLVVRDLSELLPGEE